MALKEFIEKLKKKAPLIESSMVDMNMDTGGTDVKDAVKLILDEKYNRQLANIDGEQAFLGSIFDAWCTAKNEYDTKAFFNVLKDNLFTTSGSIDGERSKQIQNIFVGQLNREFAMDIAKIRSGEGEVKEIKGAI